jgi:DNA replication protein DnaC
VTEPERGQARLRDLLANLENLIVDDDRAAEHERIVQEARAVEERQRRADRLAAQNIELEHRTHRAVIMDTGLEQRTSIRAVQKWLVRPDLKPMLILVGEHGCGKSVAAAWAVANFPDSTCWYSAKELERVFASDFGEKEKKQKRVKFSKFSVLDDIGTEADPDRMCSTLIEILEARKQRKTLVTTNQSAESWIARYSDPRLHSRLRESAYFVADKGGDMRGAK